MPAARSRNSSVAAATLVREEKPCASPVYPSPISSSTRWLLSRQSAATSAGNRASLPPRQSSSPDHLQVGLRTFVTTEAKGCSYLRTGNRQRCRSEFPSHLTLRARGTEMSIRQLLKNLTKKSLRKQTSRPSAIRAQPRLEALESRVVLSDLGFGTLCPPANTVPSVAGN